ncbi:hypothetical protein BVG79_00600 [Ketogulonicigenium robustum]|uniref:Uncharacterized protein n=1 Tax=Ketogulonicigenium robustum TaxID=92947 RepID=A0A1W6NXI8_9RHOB|nr:DUF6476 family protein [Ketogulonicigenium robustum]ARO13952.1 hypothetical protein BVG79_00600 [Ketogulonicigenium robustum]
MADSPDSNDTFPPQLRWLRRLVTTLLVVMILGFLVLIAVLVTRLGRAPALLPPEIVLPTGETALSLTMAEGWYLVVTQSGRALVFERETGAVIQDITIAPAD